MAVPVTLLYGGARHALELQLDEGVETLRMQIFSLTGLPPDEQLVTGLGPGVLADGADLRALGIQPGTWAMLDRRPAKAVITNGSQAQADRLAAAEASNQQEMHNRMRAGLRTAAAYEDYELQQKARAVVPWHDICSRACMERSQGGAAACENMPSAGLFRMQHEPRLLKVVEHARSDPAQLASLLQELAQSSPSLIQLVKSNPEDFRALLNNESPILSGPPATPDMLEVRGLLGWFKSEFFTWVNEPPCELTAAPTTACGMAPPTAEERAGGASRVELYRGPSGHITRFPRCGEWANCFTLCARAVGFDARWVLDLTDHVWTEVWSVELGRWVHCDPCENVSDAPLMYECGWGKKLNYVFAFGAHQCVDVTRRYASNWEATLGRRQLVTEHWLERLLETVNRGSQALLSEQLRQVLCVRAEEELKELHTFAASRCNALKPAEREGRKTGSYAWRRARGELGDRTSSSEVKDDGETGVARSIRRVCGAVGSVVHGLLFERDDGARDGIFLEDTKEPMDLHDDAGISRRGGIWHVVSPTERVTAIHGRHSTIGYLCAEVTFELRDDEGGLRTVVLRGADPPDTFGAKWKANIPPGKTLSAIHFADGEFVSIEYLPTGTAKNEE